MVKIYVTPTCSSCRKAKKWLEEHNVKYKEINLLTTKLTDDDLNLILKNTENGFEDIISSRSKYLIENKINVEDLKVSELEDLIIKNPSILRRPIIVEDRKMQVGYNEEDIRVFVPREFREAITCSSCDDVTYIEQLKKYYETHKAAH